eukprot:m51a1_g11111 putative metal cation zip family protein (349) ;mRNA; r:78632-80009
MELLLLVKILSIVVDPCETALGALIPWALGRHRAAARLMSVAAAAAAGVFLGVGVCHMQADAHDYLAGLEARAHGFPLSLFLLCAGFCAMLLLDRVVFPHPHAHGSQQQQQRRDSGSGKIQGDLTRQGADAEREHAHHHDGGSGSLHGVPGAVVVDVRGVPAVDGGEGDGDALLGDSAVDVDRAAAARRRRQRGAREAVVKAGVITLGVMLHSSICGLTIGVSRSLRSCVATVVACLAHDWSHACALVVLYRELGLGPVASAVFFGAFVLVEPAATGVGLGVTSALSEGGAAVASGVLSGVSSGVFVYIAVCELLREAFEDPRDRALKFVLFALFVSGIAAVSAIEGA